MAGGHTNSIGGNESWALCVRIPILFFGIGPDPPSWPKRPAGCVIYPTFSGTRPGRALLESPPQAVYGGEILGYAVIGLTEEGGYTEGLIEDLIALKDRVDVADALLDYACEYFDDRGVNTVYYQVVEGHPYQDLS